MDKSFAENFATGWVDSWNTHDLNRILSHYADDFEMCSPVIIQLTDEPSGVLRGKTAVGAYWKKALEITPDLQFELISVLVGVSSITLYYKGARGFAAEVFHFNADLKVIRAFAHYAVYPSRRSEITPNAQPYPRSRHDLLPRPGIVPRPSDAPQGQEQPLFPKSDAGSSARYPTSPGHTPSQTIGRGAHHPDP